MKSRIKDPLKNDKEREDTLDEQKEKRYRCLSTKLSPKKLRGYTCNTIFLNTSRI